MGVDNKHTQNEQNINGAAVRILCFAQEAPFSQNRSNIVENLIDFSKSMPAIVICIVSRGHKTSTQCVHRLCARIGPPTPRSYFKIGRCFADQFFCSGGTFFAKSMNVFRKSDGFS